MNYPVIKVEIIILRITFGRCRYRYLDQMRSSRLIGTQIKKNRLTSSKNKFKILDNKNSIQRVTIGPIL